MKFNLTATSTTTKDHEIELNSIEELIQFLDSTKTELILTSHKDDHWVDNERLHEYTIEVYDNYRE